MKTEDRHIEQSARDTTAFTVIKNLLIVIAFGAIMDNIYPVRFFDTPIWCLISPLLFIAYLGYRVSTNRSVEAESELYDVMNMLNEAEEAEARANAKEEEATAKLNEANAKAEASERMAINLQTLGIERQTLTSQVQTLSADLANARQELENAKQAHANAIELLKQSHDKTLSALLTEKAIAEKTAQSLEKKLNAINKEREDKKLKGSIKGSWSASGKSEAYMNEKYPDIDWKAIVLA